MKRTIKICSWGFVDPANPPEEATLFQIGGPEDFLLRERYKPGSEGWDEFGPSDVRTTPARWPMKDIVLDF